MIKIRIGPSDFDLAEVLENPGRYTTQLERAKRIQGFAECGCTEHAPRPKLVIRRLRSAFILARWPDANYKHRQGCPFQERKGHATATARTKGPFQTRNGKHLIQLDLSLEVTQPGTGQPGPRSPQASSAPRAHRRSAPLLAFLEYAWEAAGLHAWADQGYRGWNACWSMLSAEFADAKINGRPAADVLHIMRRWDPEHKAEILAEFDAFVARLTTAGTTTHRGLIIGEVGEFKPSAHGGMLVLRQSHQRYFMSNALFQKVSRSYATALAGLGRKDLRSVAVLAVEKTANGYLHVADMAAMLTNSSFLPCDSSHEAVMADHLIRLQRRFEKANVYIEKIRSFYKMASFNLWKILKQFAAKEEQENDEGREQLADEAGQALRRLTADGQQHGFANISVIVYGNTEEECSDAVSLVVGAISNAGFGTIREGTNLMPAWNCTLPGRWDNQRRLQFVETPAVSDVAPICTINPGPTRNDWLSDKAGKEMPPLTCLPTRHLTAQRVDMHEPGGNGHLFVIGPIGAGKSVFLNFLMSQSGRHNPRRIRFDKDRSTRITTQLGGGQFIDVTGKFATATRCNPLSLLGEAENHAYVTEWLILAIEDEDGFRLTPTQKTDIFDAVQILAGYSREQWTLSFFATLIHADLRERLQLWMKGGQYGDFFDNVDDAFQISDDLTIEMGELLINYERAAVLFLDYAFFRISKSMDGQRFTLIEIEEAGFFFKYERFYRRLETWLTTIRKLKSPAQWFEDQRTLLTSGNKTAQALFDAGTDVAKNIAHLAQRRQDLQSQMTLSPTAQATAQTTNQYLDLLSSQNADLIKLIGTKVQADAVKDRKENADTEEKTAAMQSVISSQDAQLQKLRQSVYTRSSTAQ